MRETHLNLTDICPHCGGGGAIKQYAHGTFTGMSCPACVAAGKQDIYEADRNIDIVKKLRAVLAMTTSSVEHEAQAAAIRLQEMLINHNLTIADLEVRGKQKPGIKQHQHDLGKAAFAWKLNLAEIIADHYFCVTLVDRRAKTVHFLGRPENVESLNLLYGWVMDQIKAISSTARKAHQQETGEHVDPLRWQLNFGLGVVDRLYWKLDAIRKQMSASVTDLVLSHKSEISDWTEETMGRRFDGQTTKRDREWQEKYRANEARLAQLKATDPEAYYYERPWERPERIAAQRAKDDAAWAKLEKRRAASSGRTKKVDARKEQQEWEARAAGRDNADNINLQPFLKKGRSE